MKAALTDLQLNKKLKIPKQRLTKSFKSFFKSHVDHRNDEDLKGIKSEVEGKVEKILSFLKTEDDKDGREKLMVMIEDFHNSYRSLFDRYDHLTEALRRKAGAKKGNDSSSSSSDSESDAHDAPKNKAIKNEKPENDVENRKANSNQELEIAYGLIREKEAANSEDLRNNIQQLKHEKEASQLELEEKSGACSTLKEQLEYAEKEVGKLNQIQKATEEENSSLCSQILQLKDEITQLQGTRVQEISNFQIKIETLKEELAKREVKAVQQTQISELQKLLTERETEIIFLQKKLEDVQNDASSHITALTEEVNHLRVEKEPLWSERSQLELQIERSKQKPLESLAQLENKDFELKKIRDQEEMLKGKEDVSMKLSEQQKNLEVHFQNSKENLGAAENKMDKIKKQFQKVDLKNQTIEQLEENIEDLKRDLEMKGDEVSTLVEDLRETEIKLRLTSQKLRVTEQLLTEKENGHIGKEEKLQEEKRLLEERVATMSGMIEIYKEAQLNMVKDISAGANDTLTGFDIFTVKCEEYYGHLDSRIYEIMNELKTATIWIKESNAEKDGLQKKTANLIQQVKYEEEQELLLRSKLGELETTLQKDENEKEILTNTIKQGEEMMSALKKMIRERDEKMGELEREINKKDEGFLSLAEEKKGAIKQLCILIDYYRNRYDDLISTISHRRRQIAA